MTPDPLLEKHLHKTRQVRAILKLMGLAAQMSEDRNNCVISTSVDAGRFPTFIDACKAVTIIPTMSTVTDGAEHIEIHHTDIKQIDPVGNPLLQVPLRLIFMKLD